jgi:hypothetical protein
VGIFDVGAGVSIQPEALFSVKGSRLRLDGSREDIRLSYVEVPVLFRYSPSEGSPHDGSTSSQDGMLRFSSVRRRRAARLGRRGTSGTPWARWTSAGSPASGSAADTSKSIPDTAEA